MGPRIQQDIYEPVKHSGKIFIYIHEWDILYPVIDIIRILEKCTIITFKHTKGQNIIKTYGSQYSHVTFGLDLKTSKDYITELYTGKVKTIFIFSNTPDPTSTNLLAFAEKYRINTVCYSTIDAKYHFYDYTSNFTEDDIANSSITKSAIVTQHNLPEEVIEKMNTLNELKELKKMQVFFPEFEIIPDLEKSNSSMETCLEKLKISHQNEKAKKNAFQTKVLFDPHLSKLKRMEYIREQKNIKYPEPPSQNIKLSSLFKKK